MKELNYSTKSAKKDHSQVLIQYRHHAFIEASAKPIFNELLQAILYMHQNGLCHRDLKPHNILLTTNEMHVKLIDFNVSKHFEKKLGDQTKLFKMTTHTGTMAFSAPEALNQEEYT